MATRTDSTKAAERLLERLRSDAALRGRVEATSTYTEFLGVARTEGLDLSGLTEAETRELLARGGTVASELSEDDLARVAGGMRKAGGDQQESFTTSGGGGSTTPTYVGPIICTW
jgi:predicted ribosomally synthesized peptide with nif11-like leader